MMRPISQSLLVGVFVLFSPLALQAQTLDWIDPLGGSYDDAFNWSPLGVPDTAGETARFNLPNTYTVSIVTSGDTVQGVQVLDGDVTYVSADINKTYTAGTTTVSGAVFTLDRPSGGTITYTTNSLTVDNEGVMNVLNKDILNVNGFLTLGNANKFGQLKVMNQANLALSGGTVVAIGVNSNDPSGVSRLEYSGAGTTGSGGGGWVIGSNGPGELYVRDGAVVTSYSTILQMPLHSGSKLLVDGGAKFAIADFGETAGNSEFTGGTIEVLSGGRFNAGFFQRHGGTTTVDGAGSILSANNFNVDTFAIMNVTNGATLEIDTSSSDFLDDGSRLTVTGNGSRIRGQSELYVGDASTVKFTLSGGAVWEPLGPTGIFGLKAGIGVSPSDRAEVTITGAGTTMNNANSSLSLSEGGGSFTRTEISAGAAVTADSFLAGYGGEAIVTLDAGSLTVNNKSEIAASENSGNISEGATATISLLPASLLHTRSTVVLGSGARIELFGGEWRMRAFDDLVGTTPTVHWNNGVVSATGAATLTPFAASILTPTGSLTFGQELRVDSTLTLQTTLSLDGGKLSVLGLSGGGLLQLNSGVFEYLDDNLVIGPGGPLGADFEMQDGLTLTTDNDVIIDGLLIGRGTIDAFSGISSTGEMRVGAGDRITLTRFGSNSGRVELTGGRLDANGGYTNSATGDVVGRGVIDTGAAGFTNRGDLALSNGQTDIFGDVTNQTTGRVIVSGLADVTFWDDVTHTGTLFNVSTGSSVTFFGQAGFSVTGGGDVFFEADVTPGSSPGLETFGGNVHFGALSNLVIELAGVAKGAQYDSLDVADTVSLSGTIDFRLIDGFTPSAGDAFEIITASIVQGAFTTESFAPLADPTLGWTLYYEPDMVIAAVTPALSGDYNFDGVVDAADYAVWRDTLGATGFGLAADGHSDGVIDTLDYDVWRSHFGESSVNALAAEAIPEPSTLTLAVLCLAGAVAFGRRSQH